MVPGLAVWLRTMKGLDEVVPPKASMVVAGVLVPHQLSVAVTAPPRLLRLLPPVLAVFPARRLKLMVRSLGVFESTRIRPLWPPSAWFPVMVTWERVVVSGLPSLFHKPAPSKLAV